MEHSHNVDLSQIPLSALKENTHSILSSGLNHHKILPNKDGLPRDWRGIAHLIGLNGVETGWLGTKEDPFCALLSHWSKNGNLSLLQNYLEVIDRYDVLDDTKDLFLANSLEYIENLNKLHTPGTNVSLQSDKAILTTDDILRLENGMEPQTYDAYVLHAEEDVNFAVEIVETMESKYNFKLCIRDRDLIGGLQFEHDAIIKLIAERCRRLVVVVSSNFLKSKANKFFVTFAQALALDIRERKVIPILYEKCEVPPELSYYFFLDYNRASKLWNFWDKLRDSIQGPEPKEKLSKPSQKFNAGTENEHWTSRRHFEPHSKDPEGTTNESEHESEKQKKSGKKKTVYNMIKSSFGRAVKHINQDMVKSTTVPVNLTTLASNNSLYFDNLDKKTNVSESNANVDNKKFKKKKFIKKKSMESLLS
ncbi:hypothetical protein RUM44_004539 [Polyplax serrata]|uniref:TIR domain-containing protein n=1 Tax=Polyplax serrata TaxID=468196 RepID=A0ABR1B360_POLSC